MGRFGSLVFAVLTAAVASTDVPCQWRSKTGANFNLQPMTVTNPTTKSYYITDGDIPCTPEIEPAYTYTWNFCSDVTKTSIPKACTLQGKTGVALQSIYLSDTDSDCFIIGHYDASQDDLHYSLIDETDPSKGVSMKYPSGDRCSLGNVPRSATIDLMCANTAGIVVSAQENTHCEYHLIMKSYHGCPTECPVTGQGLCNSHGHCAYDLAKKTPYCYCNQGYYGSSCSETSEGGPAKTYDGFSVQLGLLITLLLLAIVLIAVVGFMVYKISLFRKEQNNYSHLPTGNQEMVETVHF